MKYTYLTIDLRAHNLLKMEILLNALWYCCPDIFLLKKLVQFFKVNFSKSVSRARRPLALNPARFNLPYKLAHNPTKN